MKISPTSIAASSYKNIKGPTVSATIQNDSDKIIYLKLQSASPYWYSVSGLSTNTVSISAGGTRNININFNSVSSVGTLSKSLVVLWSNQYNGSFVEFPISVSYEIKELDVKMDAGENITISPGNFIRVGEISPAPTTENEITSTWIGIGNSLSNSGTNNTLSVSFPEPTTEYEDYTFEFRVNCPSCSTQLLTDRFIARVAKALIESFSIYPSETDLDLSSVDQSVVLNPILIPETLNILKYIWSEDPSNPSSVLKVDQVNNKTITLSSWPASGAYKFYCTAQTSVGDAISSAIINITGENENNDPVVITPFSNEDDLYNINFFIVDPSDTQLIEPNSSSLLSLSQFENLPAPSLQYGSVGKVLMPCAHPSICSIKNNKLTASNEQYVFTTYQAWALNKWVVYLNQARLSEKNYSLPIYDYPYDGAGLSKDFEITLFSTCSVNSEVDTINNKLYWFAGDTIYISNLDGTGANTVYSYSTGNPNMVGSVTSICIDVNVNPVKIYIARRWVGTGPISGSYSSIHSANISDISSTISSEITHVSSSTSSVSISKLTISKDYIYYYETENDTISKCITSFNSPVVLIDENSDNYDFKADYNNNCLYLLNQNDNTVYKIDSNDSVSSILTMPFTVSDNSKIFFDSYAEQIYISDIDEEKIVRFDTTGKRYDCRIKNEDLFKCLATDSNFYLYYLSYDGASYSLNGVPAYLDFAQNVYYRAFDIYSINYTDELGEMQYLTRVKYFIEFYDNLYRLTKIDENGYYNDVEITITYSGNLYSYWADKNVFNFRDVLINESLSNLTNYPFDLCTDDVYRSSKVFGNTGKKEYWRLVSNDGVIFLKNGSFGACGSEIKDSFSIANSSGHCTNPKIATNYNNDLFVVYEDTESGKHQIKIIGTGDFHQDSFIGPRGNYFSEFYRVDDFAFSHTITTSGVNQLADIVIDKNNVIHVIWQSNVDVYWEIYYANSGSGFNPVRITKFNSRSLNPSIIINDSGHIYISFNDDRFGKYQIMVSYKKENRIEPLFQQNEYLASLRNDYDHYVDTLIFPITNDRDNDYYISVVLKFYDNREFSGTPISVSNRDHPEWFTTNNATAEGNIANGFFVHSGETIYVNFLGSISSLSFDTNQTYFVKIEYIYAADEVVYPMIELSYSCTRCNLDEISNRWVSSGWGYSDTRINTDDYLGTNSSIDIKSNGKIIILWEDYRLKSGAKIRGASFDTSEQVNDLRSTGGAWFDYDYGILGKNPRSVTDMLDRTAICYEIDKTSNAANPIPLTAIGYRVCNFKQLPSPTETESEVKLCDFSNITDNVLTEDENISSLYVKKIAVNEEYVDYYARNSSGNSIAVVSKCNIKLDLIGTPEVLSYRVKNENDSEYSDWKLFKPEISDYYTQINHKLSSNPGIKEVCIQVATYSGITSSFSINIIADYELINYDIVLTKFDTQESALPEFGGSYVVSTVGKDFIDVIVYIIVSHDIELLSNPVFDFIQQGFNDVLGEETTIGSLPVESNVSGIVYKSIHPIRIYKDDGKYNKDGTAIIKPRFVSECINEIYATKAEIRSNDEFNYFDKGIISDTTTVIDDTLSQYRDGKTGRIGIIPDSSIEENVRSFINRRCLLLAGN